MKDHKTSNIIKKYLYIGICLLGLAAVLEANIATKKVLIHTIEQSRVVSMRIIKAHALIGLHNQFKDPKANLKNDHKLLKKNIEEEIGYLRSHEDTTDKRLLPLMLAAQKHFLKLDENDLLHDARAEKAIEFFKALEKSRVNINKVAEILTREKSERDPMFYTTRISTIGQKMAAVYLYKIWGIALPKLNEHFEMMIRKSKKSIMLLSAYIQKSGNILSPEQKDEAQKSIATMQYHLKFFIMARNMKQFVPSLLYNKANMIEQETKKIEKLLSPLVH